MTERDVSIPTGDGEFLVWLHDVQKRAILPLKWALFLVATAFWALGRWQNWPPPVDVFALFTLYLMFNAGESYFFWFSRVALPQVRPLCIVSYVVDVAFVTLLVWFDTVRYSSSTGPATDFYVFYFILILRSFALFRTTRANLMVNTIIGAVFIASLLWQDTSLPLYSARNNMIRVVFIWLVILMSAFIVQIINSQKAEIMRARENLIRSENMAVLGQLAAGVAHEINNPIGIISAYAEFLKKNAEPGDRRAEDFEAIHKEALRCRNIVEELLDYARPSADNRGQIDARGIADGVIDFLFRREAPETLRIEKDYAGHLPGVTADAGQIKQALLNVLMNARQALPAEGGTIRVSIRPDTDRGVVTIRIDDTGCGIEPDDTAKVFNPFFTRRHGGTGLGLSITKRIIEDHRGTVVLTSRRGKGTSVEIALPFDPEDPAARRGSSAFLPRIR